MSSFNVFLKLYFAWISPAPFCTILTKIYSDTKIISLSVYFSILKIWNCYGLILLNLKKSEKSIKIHKVMPGDMG